MRLVSIAIITCMPLFTTFLPVHAAAPSHLSIDNALKKRIDALDSLLSMANGGHSLERKHGHEVTDFWSQEVFRNTVEYRLVNELPKACIRSAPNRDYTDADLPLFARSGCTQGSVTWLRKANVDEAKDADLTQVALIVIYERLFAFTAQRESETVIQDLVHGLQLLARNLAPTETVDTSAVVFDDAELDIVNALPMRTAQVLGSTNFASASQFRFTRHGGQVDSLSVIGDQVVVGPGSRILDSDIDGENIVLTQTRIVKSSINGKNLNFNDVDFFSSKVFGSNLKISRSKFSANKLEMDLKDVVIEDTDISRHQTKPQVLAKISGSDFTWKKIKVEMFRRDGANVKEHYAEYALQ